MEKVKHKIKYVDEMICFQEVPNETSLSFSISNCPHNCEGCHSPYLREDIGVFVSDVLENRLKDIGKFITCVLFMGGDDEFQIDDLIECSQKCKEYGLKTALYSGNDVINKRLIPYFDYIKVGHYDKNCGPLNNINTNQRMFRITKDSFIDITNLFWNNRISQ